MAILLNIPKQNKCGIYCIKNIKTKCLYIGSSSQLQTRAVTHERLLKNNTHSNKNLKEDLKQYNKYTFQVMRICDKSENLEILELKTIKIFLMCGYNLYNCDTIESIEKRLRTYERWSIYDAITPKRKRKRYTKYMFARFPEERQQREIQKVCELLNCQPGQIMEYIPASKIDSKTPEQNINQPEHEEDYHKQIQQAQSLEDLQAIIDANKAKSKSEQEQEEQEPF